MFFYCVLRFVSELFTYLASVVLIIIDDFSAIPRFVHFAEDVKEEIIPGEISNYSNTTRTPEENIG